MKHANSISKRIAPQLAGEATLEQLVAGAKAAIPGLVDELFESVAERLRYFFGPF